jgi:hypothetical protein
MARLLPKVTRLAAAAFFPVAAAGRWCRSATRSTRRRWRARRLETRDGVERLEPDAAERLAALRKDVESLREALAARKQETESLNTHIMEIWKSQGDVQRTLHDIGHHFENLWRFQHGVETSKKPVGIDGDEFRELILPYLHDLHILKQRVEQLAAAAQPQAVPTRRQVA